MWSSIFLKYKKASLASFIESGITYSKLSSFTYLCDFWLKEANLCLTNWWLADLDMSWIRKVAEAFYPKQIVYRFLDFKPDEFLNLEGGKIEEELGHVGPNPLIGFRGCFRYIKEPDIFRLECQAIKKVREEYRMKNVYCFPSS